MSEFNKEAFSQVKPLKTFLLAVVCAEIIGFLHWLNRDVSILWPWYIALTVSVLGLLWVSFVKTRSKIWDIPIFYSVCASYLLAGGVTTYSVVHQGLEAELFTTFKNLALIMALIAPTPLWASFSVVLVCLFAPTLQSLIMSPIIANYSNSTEPWLTMSYSIVSLIALKYRFDSKITERQEIQADLEKKMKQDFSEVSLAVRDLTNTPLQSLDFIIDMLREGKISPKEASDMLEKVHYRLKEVMYAFGENKKDVSLEKGRDSFEIIYSKFSKSHYHHLSQD